MKLAVRDGLKTDASARVKAEPRDEPARGHVYEDMACLRAWKHVGPGVHDEGVEYGAIKVTVPAIGITLKPPSGRLLLGDEAEKALGKANAARLRAQYGRKRIGVEVPRELKLPDGLQVDLASCTIRDRPGIVYVRIDALFQP